MPKFNPPPGACDCHFHIFGPQKRFPLPADRKRQVPDHTLEEVIRVHNSLGLTRGLLVQPFQHGNTYEYMLHALCREPKRFRGVAIPAPDITDQEVEILHNAGVVGVRFAPRVAQEIALTLVGRIHELGWSTHILVHGADEVEAWRQQILSLPGNFVLEHTGYPPVEKAFESTEYRFLLECLDTGQCWVKLSPRFSAQRTVPFSDTVPIIRSLIQRAPERM